MCPYRNVREMIVLYYVEEGDGLEGYLITKIESEQIRLACQGRRDDCHLSKFVLDIIQVTASSVCVSRYVPGRYVLV